MKVWMLLLALCLFATSLTASPADLWQPPEPVPQQCSNFGVEVLLLDVSRSMLRSGLFERAQENAAHYIASDAPECTLVIVGSFGLTADVRAGEFLVDRQSRSRLAALVRGLRATHGYTNLDEAAKLIELLSYQLRATYGAPANRLIVKAYTDYQSRPYGDKPKFSLAEYLARRMNARHLQVLIGDGANGQHLQIQPPPEQTPKREESATTPLHLRVGMRPVLIGGIAALLLTLTGLWYRKRAGEALGPSAPLGAFLVTESVDHPDGEATEVIARERRVDVATGVPVVFSTDGDQGTYVASPAPDAVQGELFRATPLRNGQICVESAHPRATLNDEPVAGQRVRISLERPIRIRLGRRLFELSGVFAAAHAPRPGEDLFHAQSLRN